MADKKPEMYIEVYGPKLPATLPDADLLFELLATGALTFEMGYTKKSDGSLIVNEISIITPKPLRGIQHDK